jgi:NADPH-dependent glutamate synthase beta subunit-like oxidoreductase
VVVVGGGSSAMDAARTARRLDAEEVLVLYRRSRPDMPAAPQEVEEAAAEGVEFEFMVAPVSIHPNGRLRLECVRMEPGPVDASGRRRPVPIEGSEFELETDAAIMAIGQTPEPLEGIEALYSDRGRLMADPDTLHTEMPGMFAAGDAVTGPASVIEAIAAGRRAAQSIDRYLGGEGDIDEMLAPPEETEGMEPLEEQEERPPVRAPLRPASERVGDFAAVELGYTEEQALEEALRCLRCDLEEELEE